MLLALVGVAAGLALLTYAADQFVVGSARISVALRLSRVVIGAVVIGFGTSAPEMLVSGLAAAQGSLDLAFGNIVGSNVANLTLVLGVAAVITPIGVSSPTLKREAPLSLGAVVLFAVLVQNGLTGVDAALLFAALVVALVLVLWSARDDDPDLTASVDDFLHERQPSLGRESIRTLLGLVGTLAGAQLLVVSAQVLARRAGLSEAFIGLTIVAIGTSLPELATAIQAARKHETDLVVGNLLGSNLFNATAVGGLAGLLGPRLLADHSIVGPATLLMVVVSAIATAFMVTGRRVMRWEGVLLLVGYVAVLPLLAR